MVIALTRNRRTRAALMTEMLVAMSLLILVLLPLAYSLASEKRLARGCYERAIAMEIVDGEMEVLLAGEWKRYGPGTHPYAVQNGSMVNLSPGRFVLTIATNLVRLEWLPDSHHHGGAVLRQATLPASAAAMNAGGTQ
jgi:hypothetical protein